MAEQTPNLGLAIQGQNDNYDIDAHNENYRKIDTAISKIKVTPEEIGAETPAGAQKKADTAESNAKAHANTVAGQAETNAKNASLPRTGGTINGDLAVTNTLYAAGRNVIAELDSVKQSGVDKKNRVAGAINAKDVPASAADDWDALIYKIGLIQTPRGTTNMPPNFWSKFGVVSGTPDGPQGRLYFQNGKILSGYIESFGIFDKAYGLREYHYNGTILSQHEFGRGEISTGFMLEGPIVNKNILAIDNRSGEVLIHDHSGTLLFQFPKPSQADISDFIVTSGKAFGYDARYGKLFDHNGTVIISVQTNENGHASRVAYFVDDNTLVVDSYTYSSFIRWNGGAWTVDQYKNSGGWMCGVMGMYLAALAAR
ncbi:hypothetical protein [Paenibacillus alvei]|uniref:hypothetical protein n=1 Tax=Paenibacillus alvei TaxID=44250 RepID=UPI00227E7400|nr:hypothetical protein [Paenibacillus alvei]